MVVHSKTLLFFSWFTFLCHKRRVMILLPSYGCFGGNLFVQLERCVVLPHLSHEYYIISLKLYSQRRGEIREKTDRNLQHTIHLLSDLSTLLSYGLRY